MRSSNVIVREMKIEDIAAVFRIEQSSFPTPWSPYAFERELTQNKMARYFVIEVDNLVVGYGGMWIIIDEAHITNIAISPEYRNKRLGSILLKAMIDFAEKNGVFKMTLEVRKSNLAAQRLYEKYGFVAAGIRPKYYQDTNEDAVIMWREIKN